MMMKELEKRIIPGCEERYYKGNNIGCLLIHGFKSCPYEMVKMGEYLNKQGYTVHVVLLPGHGTSPEDLENVKWYEWHETVKQAYFELKNNSEKIIVAGLSTGGSLALHLAAHYKVDGIIALAPGLFLKKKTVKFAHILKYVWKFVKDRSGPDISINETTKTYHQISVKAVSELLKFFKHMQDDLREVKAPILIIYSEQDHVVNPKSSLTIYENISSENKKIIKLDKSYHILTLDIEKEKVFFESAQFIKQIIKNEK